ncbi:MAG: tyrosine-type recombinase/integrase [Acidipropionibacterium jensenii]|nr:tyrosine-type recombinase/integrase [Acidipropionibacterium jensenii]
MSVRKEPNGRFRAVLKSGRQHVTSKTFDTKREATEWLSRERAALVGGIDPRAGRVRTRALVAQWLEVREVTVAKKTYRTDQDLLRLMPMSMQNMGVAAISAREVSRSFESLIKQGLAESSVVRYRASLSSFFSWCVRERFITSNPVTGVRVPKSSAERVEMSPWSEAELEARYLAWKKYDERLADILLVMGWTGLRWAEARALTVGDIALGDSPALRVQRSDPEGVGVKSTKGRRSRRVPLANRVLPIVLSLSNGKFPSDLLLTTSNGSQLHRSAVLRAVHWQTTGQGRRIHDLRHTAACLWPARSVDPGTVQQWRGPESIATTNRYLHHLGTAAEAAGLARLNGPLSLISRCGSDSQRYC